MLKKQNDMDIFEILLGISREQFMEDVKFQIVIKNPDSYPDLIAKPEDKKDES